MSITVSACLTNTGSQTLGPTLQIYRNPVTQTNPGTLIQTVPTSSITGANCPYTITAPDGTTTIRIQDPVTLCYVDLPVNNTNVCVNCSLSLNSVSNNLIGQINVGSLIGTCDNSIGDYTMSWYGPNSTTTEAFTSGQGTAFNGLYQYTHPLTSSNTPLLNPGSYVGKITRVDLNGLKFTSTGDAGTVLSPTLTDCVTNVNVATYTCSNGAPVDTYYKHLRTFSYNGSQDPQVLITTLQLDIPTQYVIFSFQGYGVSDTIKFTLFGSAYPGNPIQLEECTVGTTANNFTPTSWPKGINTTNSFKKILNLTGLNVNVGDTIQIKITPNPSTKETNWRLAFGCSTQPTGNKNCLDSYRNTPYKIKTSTLLPSYNTTSCPNEFNLNFSVVGCTQATNNSQWFNSNLFNLVNTEVEWNYNIGSSGNDGLIPLTATFNNSYVKISRYGLYPTETSSCMTSVGVDYRVEKVVGSTPSLTFYFRNATDVNNILPKLQANFNYLVNFNSFGIQPGTYSTDNTNINYYRMMRIRVKSNNICGDGATYEYTEYPLNSTIQSGALPTPYLTVYTHFIKITPPSMAYNPLICPSNYCTCDEAEDLVSNVNYYREYQPFIFTLNRYETSPIDYANYCVKENKSSKTSVNLDGQYVFKFPYGDRTYPSQGGPNYNNSLLPSLPNGSTTWDWENHWAVSSDRFGQRVFYYQARAKTPITNPLGYEIWAYAISNFAITGSLFKIYDTATGGIVPGNESFFV
jgi:hypothetical protein